jgi:methylmalonyl-CoA/ethylmalonyl-CoA epimerase
LRRIDHISMAAPSWKTQSEKLQRLLGFKFLHSWEAHPGEDFAGSVSQVRGTEIEFEVIEPAGEHSFVQKYLDERGPGLHHITAQVEDIDEAAAELQRLGITPFGGIADDGQWRLTYIHPRDSGGILWQLFVPKRAPQEIDRSAGGGVVNLQRVDHVSLATTDIEKQVEFQQRVFGMEVEGRWQDDFGGYKGGIMRIPGSKLKFEMMEPTRPDSFMQRFIDQRRAGMHHICCEVASVEGAVEGLKAEGIEAFGGIIQNDWRKHTFLHPKDSGGVLFQLFEEPAER